MAALSIEIPPLQGYNSLDEEQTKLDHPLRRILL